jgi:predicted O-linked N-acetylglucosamine transferase (SPINDLY family)
MTPHEATEEGLKLHRQGRLDEAEAHYAAALNAQPDFHPALHFMGLLRQQRGDAGGALTTLDQALAAAPAGYPHLAALAAARGEVLFDLQRMDEALAGFDQAVGRDPGFAAAWNNRGLVLKELGRLDDALDSFARAAALAPGSTEPHSNHGDILRQLHRYTDSLASFARGLALNPHDTASLINRAASLVSLGRIDEALSDLDKALARNPDLPEALFARSHLAWSKKSNLKAALADLTRLVAARPDFPYGLGALMRLEMTAAQWDDFAVRKAQLDEGVRADKPVTAPFIYLSVCDRPADILRCARPYARANFPARPPTHKTSPRRPGPIRIGYVCGEFRAHPTLYLMAGLFEAHDRNEFEIFAFDNGGSDASPLRARLEKTPTRIINITRLSDHEAAARIAKEEIDILVDLNGYSGEQRLGVFAMHSAPVQVSWLGYPGTLGASFIDYILADRIVIPEDAAPYYSEKIAWLPHSYQINDGKRAVAETPTRAEAGLPDEGFVFCNFNHANKFTPGTFDRWMRLLQQVPGSLLWLLKPNVLAEDNLKREAEARGVAQDRLVFAPHLPFDRHLARLKLAGLFLDGLPYGAHTTASDALWAGLPLITWMGNSFAGRVGASLLSALNMPELITTTGEGFEDLALSLARDPARLAIIRERLAAARVTAPLFDTGKTTRAIERAWRIMFENHGKPPESFSVPDGP